MFFDQRWDVLHLQMQILDDGVYFGQLVCDTSLYPPWDYHQYRLKTGEFKRKENL